MSNGKAHDLKQLETFVHFLHLLHSVERMARTPGTDRPSNVSEHSYQVVMLCWYIMDVLDLDLDREKVFSYALAHDVIEAYAGDTYIYDKEALETKAAREQKAFEKIKTKFNEFPSLLSAIETYEKRGDEESKFVYAVDKLIDPLNITMEEGRSHWKENDVAYEDIRTYKDKKVAVSKDVKPYWKLLIEKIERNKEKYFDR